MDGKVNHEVHVVLQPGAALDLFTRFKSGRGSERMDVEDQCCLGQRHTRLCLTRISELLRIPP
jgi:hypothetical protein